MHAHAILMQFLVGPNSKKTFFAGGLVLARSLSLFLTRRFPPDSALFEFLVNPLELSKIYIIIVTPVLPFFKTLGMEHSSFILSRMNAWSDLPPPPSNRCSKYIPTNQFSAQHSPRWCQPATLVTINDASPTCPGEYNNGMSLKMALSTICREPS